MIHELLFLFKFLNLSILRHRNDAHASSIAFQMKLEKKMSFRIVLSLMLLIFGNFQSSHAFAEVSDRRCPSYCVGTTLYTGTWRHGHGDPGCGFTATPEAQSCRFGMNLADRLSYHRFRSVDGQYGLSFHGFGLNAVDISVGQSSELVHFSISDHEITFVDTTYLETRTVWLVSEDELSIYSGDTRVKLHRVDPL